MTNERDEMARMAEAAENLGDEPPVIEVPKVEEPKVETEPAPDELAGGLEGGVSEEPHEGRIDLDELLDIKPKEAAAEEPPKVEAEEAAPEPEPTAVDKRISELTERTRVLQEQNDKFVEQALARGAPGEAPQEEPAPELDGEVEDYMGPYIEKYLKEQGISPEHLKQSMASAAEPSLDARRAEVIAKRVPGFKVEHIAALKDAYNGLPEGSEDREFYGDGAAGLTQLAQDLVSRGALDVGQKKQNQTSPLAGRHRSEAGATPAATEGEDDMAKATRLMDMDDAEFIASIRPGLEG